MGVCGAGSSPHARGTLAQRDLAVAVERFIPACAGNTTTGCAFIVGCSGSSPHARGTRAAIQRRRCRGRFIPACAGNTSSQCRRRRCRTVHPRMRGEHTAGANSDALNDGSSPHARGTQPPRRCGQACARFIPACAGNTRTTSTTPRLPAVHPRMRGEHAFSSVGCAHDVGSSPHARGTLPWSMVRFHHGRFIPACAGNTAPINVM